MLFRDPSRASAALFLALGAVLISPPAFSEIKSSKPVDKIAAVVGDDIILLSEIQKEVAPELKELETAASQGGPNPLMERRRAKLYRDALEEMINDALMASEAVGMQIEVGSDEVDRAMQNMAQENNIDLETFKKAIVAQGSDILTYRNALRKQILRYKVLNLRVRGRVKISEAEARQYYNDQVRDVRATGSFEGAHILIRVGKETRAAEVAAARKRAEEIMAKIQNGEDFAEAAKRESEDQATAKRGGSLGTLRPGVIPPVLDQAFLDLETGEISGPIRTTAGFHIIKLIQREELGVELFSEVKSRIMAQLAQEEMARQEKIWLKELKLKTFIDIRL